MCVFTRNNPFVQLGYNLIELAVAKVNAPGAALWIFSSQPLSISVLFLNDSVVQMNDGEKGSLQLS